MAPGTCTECGIFGVTRPEIDGLMDSVKLKSAQDIQFLAHTNHILPYTQSTGIATTLANLVDWMSQVESQIVDLRKTQVKIQKAQDLCKATLAPIRRLPDDIIREVLLHGAKMWPCLTLKSLPWVASHVCHRWRNVCLSYAPLWSNISVSASYLKLGPVGGFHYTSAELNILKCVLARSRELPLFVQFHSSRRASDDNLAIGLLQLVLEQSHRLRGIVLNLFFVNDLSILDRKIHNFPMLKYLTWRADRDYNVHKIFSDAPALREVKTERLFQYVNHLPLAGLTLVEVDYADSATMARTIPSMQNLRRLQWWDIGRPANVLLSLPHLHNLRCNGRHLTNSVLPSLQVLKVIIDTISDQEGLFDFLENSRRSLVSLEILGNLKDSPRFPETLAGHTDLLNLQFRFDSTAHIPFILRLGSVSAEHNQRLFLPSLKYLILEVPAGSDPEDALADFQLILNSFVSYFSVRTEDGADRTFTLCTGEYWDFVEDKDAILAAYVQPLRARGVHLSSEDVLIVDLPVS